MIELNKIYNEDCKEGIKKLADNSVDLAIFDPPYIDVVSASWDKGNNPFDLELINETFRVLKPTGNFYIWCGIGEKSQSLIEFFNLMKDSKFYFKDLITWKKQRGIGMRKGWLYTREECLWYVKDNKQFVWNKEDQYSDEVRKNPKGFNGKPTKSDCKRFSNVWSDIVEESFNTSEKELNSEKRQHLTPKPTKAIERIIKLHTNENDIILDCFMGSGSTAISCINTNRNYIGFELDNTYYNLANERIEKHKESLGKK